MTLTLWRAIVRSYHSPADADAGYPPWRVVERVEWARFFAGEDRQAGGTLHRWALSTEVEIAGDVADIARVRQEGPWELLTAARACEDSLRVVVDAGEPLPRLEPGESLRRDPPHRGRRHALRESPRQLHMEWAS